VPKVTRKGGGSALPWKSRLFRDIVRAAVRAAAPGGVPVTVKMRKGVDDDHLTFLEAGRAAEDEGVAAVALHGRTAAQHYSGTADWTAIGELKQAVTTIPVLGNGDIWSADDALEMVRRTGCDGVVVGRGCLGRPWLFADLAAAFAGRSVRVRPALKEVAAAMRRHTELLAEHYGDELKACRDIRKHVAWYLKGFRVGQHLRAQLALVETLAGLDELLAQLDVDQPWPGEPAEGQRGRAGSPRRVALPEGWLDSRVLEGPAARMIREAELSVSGG
jgi:nifR3 family TIM-barrel protein